MEKSELYALSIPLSNKCGIYFLFDDEELVYIGQSVNITARIGHHVAEKEKTFNRVAIIECEPADLSRLEAAYILKFKPKFNKHIPYDSISYFIPLSIRNILRNKGFNIDGIQIRKIIRKLNLQSLDRRFHLPTIENYLTGENQ